MISKFIVLHFCQIIQIILIAVKFTAQKLWSVRSQYISIHAAMCSGENLSILGGSHLDAFSVYWNRLTMQLSTCSFPLHLIWWFHFDLVVTWLQHLSNTIWWIDRTLNTNWMKQWSRVIYDENWGNHKIGYCKKHRVTFIFTSTINMVFVSFKRLCS